MSYVTQIQERINKAADGAIFVGSDFVDIAGRETIRRTLNRLVDAGMLRRIIKGVYEKPKFSMLLDEFVAPDTDAVAHAIARSYHWTIVPCGNTALNILGLSTQVPVVWCYYSDGPYKTYEWGTTKLEFKRRTNKEITGLSYTTALVVHALKALGKTQTTPKVIEHLSSLLSDAEKHTLLEEGIHSTAWVYEAIRKINGEGGTGNEESRQFTGERSARSVSKYCEQDGYT